MSVRNSYLILILVVPSPYVRANRYHTVVFFGVNEQVPNIFGRLLFKFVVIPWSAKQKRICKGLKPTSNVIIAAHILCSSFLQQWCP